MINIKQKAFTEAQNRDNLRSSGKLKNMGSGGKWLLLGLFSVVLKQTSFLSLIFYAIIKTVIRVPRSVISFVCQSKEHFRACDILWQEPNLITVQNLFSIFSSFYSDK